MAATDLLPRRARQLREESLALEAQLRERADPGVVLACLRELTAVQERADEARTWARQELRALQREGEDVRAEEARWKAAGGSAGGALTPRKRSLLPQTSAAPPRQQKVLEAATDAFRGRLNSGTGVGAAIDFLGVLARRFATTDSSVTAQQFFHWSQARLREVVGVFLTRTVPFPEARGNELTEVEWTRLCHELTALVGAAQEASVEGFASFDDALVLELTDPLLRLAMSALAVEAKPQNEGAFCQGVRKVAGLVTTPRAWEVVQDGVARRCRNFVTSVEADGGASEVMVAERVRDLVSAVLHVEC